MCVTNWGASLIPSVVANMCPIQQAIWAAAALYFPLEIPLIWGPRVTLTSRDSLIAVEKSLQISTVGDAFWGPT